LRSADLPDPAAGIVTWSAPSAPTPPPPLPTSTPPPPRARSGSVSRESRPAAVTEAVEPPPAPGPAVSVVEPEGPPLEESRPPCLFNCAGSTPEGVGDGSRGGPTGPGASEGNGNGPIRITGGEIKPPVRTVYVAPIYPDIARVARVSGTVVVECTIDPSGRVVDARVITGHPLLNESALDAVRRWRYEPTRLNHVPVAVLMTVTVRFIAQR